MASVSVSATQKLRAPARRARHRMLSFNDSQPRPRKIRKKRQSGPTGESTTGPSAEEASITILIPSSSTTMPPSSSAASSSSTSTLASSSVASNSAISSSEASSAGSSSSSSSVLSTSSTSSTSFTSIHPSFSSSSSSLSFSLSSSDSFTFSSTSYSWLASPTSWSSMTNAWSTVQYTTLTTTQDETITVEHSQSSFTSQFEPVNPSTRTITSVSNTSSGVLSTNSPEGNSFSRNTGAIVGVALAVALVVISAAFLVFYGCRRYRKLHNPNQGLWRPPLGDDDSERLSVAGQAALRRATLPNVESSEPLTRSSTQTHALLSRHSSEGQQLSSLDHSSGESSTHALLSPMSRVGYFGDAPPSSFIPPPERAHRLPGVADIVIPQPAQVVSLPRSPSSPTSIYSNHASLLNPPLVAPAKPAIIVSPDPAPQWPPPPVHVPPFGSSSELPRLLQNNSHISFRDDADYSRPIVGSGGLGGAVDVSDDEDDISTAPTAL